MRTEAEVRRALLHVQEGLTGAGILGIDLKHMRPLEDILRWVVGDASTFEGFLAEFDALDNPAKKKSKRAMTL
ncbi:MAG: hypothetical protein NVS1B14_04150 [Vulcanimicrobiaceae bacterium]